MNINKISNSALRQHMHETLAAMLYFTLTLRLSKQLGYEVKIIPY